MKVASIVLWVIWASLLLAWFSDLLVVLMRDPGEASEPDGHFVGVLAITGLVGLGFSFFLKWLLFRFLINPKRVRVSSPWAITIFVIGSLMIWGLTKSVETYGLIIFFGSESLAHYFAFWIPSLLVMLVHMPSLLDPRRSRYNAAGTPD